MTDLKPIGFLRPFTKFCCTIGNIPTSYMVSLTYEEQLLWLCDFLKNTVIPTVNQNAEAVNELQSLFTDLQNYVNNYFDNLDVQEEINNKLDELVENGVLPSLIGKYVDPIINQQNQKIDEQNQIIGEQNQKIANIMNLSPLPVSNVQEMIDHSKIYINTSDGKWYFYDNINSEWTIGGDFQAAGIADNQINILNLDNTLQQNFSVSFSEWQKLPQLTTRLLFCC